MIGYHGYVLYQSERTKTCAERRAEDARRGEVAAALLHSFQAVTRRPAYLAARRHNEII
jgi:hypothetical protein